MFGALAGETKCEGGIGPRLQRLETLAMIEEVLSAPLHFLSEASPAGLSAVNIARESESTLPALAPLPQFALWAARMLGLPASHDSQGRITLQLSTQDDRKPGDHGPSPRAAAAVETMRQSLGGVHQVHFPAGDCPALATAEQNGQAAPLTADGPLVTALTTALRELGPAISCIPRRQPNAVSDLASHLFSAYQVEGGRAHLAGCALEDRPILRLTFRCSVAAGELPSAEPIVESDAAIRHVFIGDDGQLCDAELVEQLELNDLLPREERRPLITEQDLQAWINAGRQTLAALQQRAGDPLLAAAVIWCKYATGKVAVVIGNAAIELPFSAWARLLADGRVKPPPYRNPHTGSESYHLAATDDGRIVAADDIGKCSKTGERVLREELQQCAVTNRWARPEFFADCPVTETRVLKSELQVCRTCQQAVSPAALRSGECAACHSLKRVNKADPRLARLLGERPELDQWRSWRVAETSAYYVLVASGLVNRLLLVVSKETLELIYLARGSRLSSKWTPVPAEQRGDYLK